MFSAGKNFFTKAQSTPPSTQSTFYRTTPPPPEQEDNVLVAKGNEQHNSSIAGASVKSIPIKEKKSDSSSKESGSGSSSNEEFTHSVVEKTKAVTVELNSVFEGLKQDKQGGARAPNQLNIENPTSVPPLVPPKPITSRQNGNSISTYNQSKSADQSVNRPLEKPLLPPKPKQRVADTLLTRVADTPLNYGIEVLDAVTEDSIKKTQGIKAIDSHSNLTKKEQEEELEKELEEIYKTCNDFLKELGLEPDVE